RGGRARRRSSTSWLGTSGLRRSGVRALRSAGHAGRAGTGWKPGKDSGMRGARQARTGPRVGAWGALWQLRAMASPRPAGMRRPRAAACARAALVAALLVAGPGAVLATAKPKPALADDVLRLDALLDSIRVARGVPGLAAAVVEHGRLTAIGA